VLVRAHVHQKKRRSVCVCVCQRDGKRERQSASPVLCAAILLANAPHPLSVLLSQDSDTQMLVDASSQSSQRKGRGREREREGRGEEREREGGMDAITYSRWCCTGGVGRSEGH